MMNLGKIIAMAAAGHENQEDKAGKAYILHPIRIMMKFQDFKDAELYMATAICHDLIEDTKITLQHLREIGVVEEVIRAIDAMTKREGESYVDYLIRVKLNRISTEVKKEDLKDNSDLYRLKGVRPKDFIRAKKYIAAYSFLDDKIDLDELRRIVKEIEESVEV